jgi:ribulose 1,5-bisphosphate carboxylase large subunit-like protein
MEEMLKFSNEYTKTHQGINFEIKKSTKKNGVHGCPIITDIKLTQ